MVKALLDFLKINSKQKIGLLELHTEMNLIICHIHNYTEYNKQ